MSSLPENMRVLSIGKDARTDALVSECAKSPSKPVLLGLSELEAPGMIANCEQFVGKVSLTDVSAMMEVVREMSPDLVIVGPEEPLGVGIVDAIEDELGTPCFGPRSTLARIETSKTWARSVLQKYEVPGSPEFRNFFSDDGIAEYVREIGAFVVKPDGLTGGKGVRVSGEHFSTDDEGIEYAISLVESDGSVLIEEKLEGEEFSLQTITDGTRFVHCPLVQDHKRAFDGDQGPNTGGMGSYSLPDHGMPFLAGEEISAARHINELTAAALRQETGLDFRGVLYGGFMATKNGLRLIEYNARFGDPETMNVLPLYRGDVLDLIWSAANGNMDLSEASFENLATVCKYVVPETYPHPGHAGEVIELPSEVHPNARYYWAATNQVGDDVRLTSSRAVAAVGIGESLRDAERIAEEAASAVKGPVRHRRDIGTQPVLDKRIGHMTALRGRSFALV